MFGGNRKAQTKKELEKYVAGELKDVLVLKNNTNLTLAFVALIQGNGVLHCENEELDSNFTLAFSDINGIPNIQRYDVLEEKDITPDKLSNMSDMLGQKTEHFVETLKQDLCVIEAYLYEGVKMALEDLDNDSQYDISFLEVEGLSYGYFTDDVSTPTIRITALIDTNEDDELEVIYKYSTDNAINMAFKNDADRISKI